MSSKDFLQFMSEKNKQIQTLQKKQQSVDFNAYNYDIEELAAILKFEKFPLNPGKIKRRILELKRKFKNQQKYLTFFDECQQRLIEDFENHNQQTWEEPYERGKTSAGKVLEQQFQEQNEEEVKGQISQIINKEKDIIGIARQPQSSNYMPKNVVQGNRNPFLITEIQRVVSFDSRYRKFLTVNASDCSGVQTNLQRRLYTSTNYTVDLNQPLTNVVSITLDSVEIPNSWYTFSSDYGTNQFKIVLGQTGEEYVIAIENGNYQQEQLVQAINKQIYDATDVSNNYVFRGYFDVSKNYTSNAAIASSSYLPFPIIELKYFSHNNKAYIFNYDPDGRDLNVTWYDNESLDVCAARQEAELPRPGGKVDYNLGWLSGFRGQTSIVKPYNYATGGCVWESNSGSVSGQSRTPPGGVITPSSPLILDSVTNDTNFQGYTIPKSTIDIKGPQYFIITLDDFNNNKPNKDMISLIDTVDTQLKVPTYINTQTMNKQYGLGAYEIGYQGIPGFECVDVADVNNNDRQCSTNDLNIDLSSNLTKAQKYTAEQIQFFNKQSSINRYNSPNPTDYIGRISVNRNPLDWDTSIIYKNPDPKLTERKYFGPVKLVKFKIRLLNDKGFEVNLNDRDWSFSIIVSHLYQY